MIIVNDDPRKALSNGVGASIRPITSYSVSATPVINTGRVGFIDRLNFIVENLYDEAETDAEILGLSNGVEYRFQVVANTEAGLNRGLCTIYTTLSAHLEAAPAARLARCRRCVCMCQLSSYPPRVQ